MTITIQVCMLNCHSCVQLYVGLWIVACHPLHPWYSLGKILEWVAMPHSPGDLPDPGIELMSLTSPALAGRFFTTTATWEASTVVFICSSHYCCVSHSVLSDSATPCPVAHQTPLSMEFTLLIYPSPISPLVTMRLFSASVNLFLFCK